MKIFTYTSMRFVHQSPLYIGHAIYKTHAYTVSPHPILVQTHTLGDLLDKRFFEKLFTGQTSRLLFASLACTSSTFVYTHRHGIKSTTYLDKNISPDTSPVQRPP